MKSGMVYAYIYSDEYKQSGLGSGDNPARREYSLKINLILIKS